MFKLKKTVNKIKEQYPPIEAIFFNDIANPPNGQTKYVAQMQIIRTILDLRLYQYLNWIKNERNENT